MYHLVLYAGRLTAAQRAPADTAFFAINVGAFAALAARCWPCTAARATRGRIKTLLLQFILTFVVQMLMVRLAFRRPSPNPHPNPHPHPNLNPNPNPNPNQVGLAFRRYAVLTAAKGLVAPGWLALWLIYLVGILAKGTERPRCRLAGAAWGCSLQRAG